jgi:formylglycine-generating enzyme required for sulfatase activity
VDFEVTPRQAESLSKLPKQNLVKLPLQILGQLPSDMLLQFQPIVNSVGMEFKLLPAGKFVMGSNNGQPNETPHDVVLTKSFCLGIYQVTQEQYEQVMGQTPSKFKGAKNPVEQVSWEDAVQFCRKLSRLPAEKAAGRVYRLPSEAEWEYACRAGKTTEYCFGDDEGKLAEYGWFDENSESKTHPVGQKSPSPWGLYDMHGNVWEWCQDWYDEDYYKDSLKEDPRGPLLASSRVCRGGSWRSFAGGCRAALRCGNTPSHRASILGFRVALVPPGQ